MPLLVCRLEILAAKQLGYVKKINGQLTKHDNIRLIYTSLEI